MKNTKILEVISLFFILFYFVNGSWNTVTVAEANDSTNDMSTCYQGANPNRTNSVYATFTFDSPPTPNFIETQVFNIYPAFLLVDDKDNTYGAGYSQIFAYNSDMTVKWLTSIRDPLAGISLSTELGLIYTIFFNACFSEASIYIKGKLGILFFN